MTGTEIFVCTEEGHNSCIRGHRPLSPALRALLLCVDGERSIAGLMDMFPELDEEVFLEQVRFLLAERLIEPRRSEASVRAERDGANVDVDELASWLQHWIEARTPSSPAVPDRRARTGRARKLLAANHVDTVDLRTNGFLITGRHRWSQADAGRATRIALVYEPPQRDGTLICGHLTLAGYKVALARTRREVCDAVNFGATPAVIILRYGSPDLDAMRALARFRRHPRLADTPIVFLSRHSSRSAIAKSVLLGCHAWLSDPPTAAGVASVLGQVMKETRRPSFPELDFNTTRSRAWQTTMRL